MLSYNATHSTGHTAAAPVLKFYTRAGCRICRHAQALLESWETPLEVIDIAGDEALIAEHGHFVPVLSLEVTGEGGDVREHIWHRGPLTREHLPPLKMRLLRLTRREQLGRTSQGGPKGSRVRRASIRPSQRRAFQA